MVVKMKRIYEEATEEDGIRILVDRLWPRGVSKERARLDYWLKDIGPSHELRKWFSHDPVKFEEFKERYIEELSSGEQAEALAILKTIVKDNQQQITLLFAAKNEKQNQVHVLKRILKDQ